MIHLFTSAEGNDHPLFARSYPVEGTLDRWASSLNTGTLIQEPAFAQSFLARLDGHDTGPILAVPDQADLNFINEISALALKLVMVMGAAPHLLEEAKLERSARLKHGHLRPELWSPNILGRHYTIKRESQGGTHASPRLHMRAGHTRMQPYGPRETPSHRPIWIEPTLIGAAI